MGEILMFEARPRPSRTSAERADAPMGSQGAEILFFMGVRYEPYVEAPPAPSITAKPRKRASSPPQPSGKPRKRPA